MTWDTPLNTPSGRIRFFFMACAPVILGVVFLGLYGIAHSESFPGLLWYGLFAGAMLPVIAVTWKQISLGGGESRKGTVPSDKYAIRLIDRIVTFALMGLLLKWIDVISGEGHPDVYSPRLLNHMRSAEPHIHATVLSVVAGPVLLLHDIQSACEPPLI